MKQRLKIISLSLCMFLSMFSVFAETKSAHPSYAELSDFVQKGFFYSIVPELTAGDKYGYGFASTSVSDSEKEQFFATTFPQKDIYWAYLELLAGTKAESELIKKENNIVELKVRYFDASDSGTKEKTILKFRPEDFKQVLVIQSPSPFSAFAPFIVVGTLKTEKEEIFKSCFKYLVSTKNFLDCEVLINGRALKHVLTSSYEFLGQVPLGDYQTKEDAFKVARDFSLEPIYEDRRKEIKGKTLWVIFSKKSEVAPYKKNTFFMKAFIVNLTKYKKDEEFISLADKQIEDLAKTLNLTFFKKPSTVMVGSYNAREALLKFSSKNTNEGFIKRVIVFEPIEINSGIIGMIIKIDYNPREYKIFSLDIGKTLESIKIYSDNEEFQIISAKEDSSWYINNTFMLRIKKIPEWEFFDYESNECEWFR